MDISSFIQKEKKLLIISAIVIILSFIIGKSCNNGRGGSEDNIDSLKAQIVNYQINEKVKNDLIIEFNQKLDGYIDVTKELNARQQQVDSLTKLIREQGKATTSQNQKLNSLLIEINDYIDANEDLKDEFDLMKLSNDQTKIVQVLLDNIKAKKEEIRLLKEEINTLTSDISSLKIDNQNLKVQIDVEKKDKEQIKSKASELQIGAFNVSLPLNNLKAVKRAKNVDQIGFEIEVLANEFAEIGNKKIYLRIIQPNGKALYEKESDYFISERSDKLQYTLYQEFKYNKQRKVLNLTWQKTETYLSPGQYEVIVFLDGKQIKSKTFSLEK